jgi:hypothetical protein
MRALPADSTLPLATVPGLRWPRWPRRLVLLAAVLGLHGWLIDRLLPLREPPGGAAPWRPAVQVRTLVAPVIEAPAPADRVALAAPVARPARAARADAPAPHTPGRPARSVMPAAAASAAAPSDAATDASATASLSSAAPGEVAQADMGEPPPVYATRLPAPTLLRYQWRQGLRTAEALLSWRHDGQRYRLQFDAWAGPDQPLIEQLSLGGFDAAGLAPLRFTDRRHGRSQQAANFRRDIGRISFSGPQVDYPAWPGAQDRLSWLTQLVAIQAAAAPPLPPITVFVVDAWGGGELWRFQPVGEDVVDTPLGRLAARRWLREPERPEGQRVELWLDPTRGHWPVQVRFTLLRSAESSELRLAAEPVTPP